MNITHVVGARPNFMKVSPVLRSLDGHDGVHQLIVHTGQHYDVNMSGVFFQQLGIREPDLNLEVGSGSHAWQTAEIMRRFEPVLLEWQPDLVLVYGDVNSTVAAALVCSKLQTPIGHVEAGLRSFDRSMPEEINRLLTDQLADLLFTPSADGNENLSREGVAPEKVYLVGNAMIDTLVRHLPDTPDHWNGRRLESGPRYGLVTLHRPSTVDEPAVLGRVFAAMTLISRDLPLVFPVHPRTRKRLREFESQLESTNMELVEPLSYLDFLALQRHATLVITDSGGVQEETTFLGVPCLTVRDQTERPVTVGLGTNTVVGQNADQLGREARRVLDGEYKHGQIPPLWDGRAAERIAVAIVEWWGNRRNPRRADSNRYS